MMPFSKFTTFVSYAVLAGFLAMPTAMAQDKQTSTISVSGTGTTSVAPDMALISVGVLREADTAREALDANNKAMAKVLAAMKDKGIAGKDLQTSNFSIQPRYFYPKRKSTGEQPPPKITGYVVSNNLDVRVRDLARTGEILDLAVTLGVNSGGQIRFLNDKTDEILKAARIAAVKDATGKARTLTETAGAGLGRILSISENSRLPGPQPLARAKVASAAIEDASVPVASGENTYQINVQISWEIDQ